MLSQESDHFHEIVAHGETHRQVLQPLRVGLLLTTRFLFAGASISSTAACFPISAAMLEGRYRGHGTDGRSKMTATSCLGLSLVPAPGRALFLRQALTSS